MANGADIPYQLRPNKFIDRQIFIELLSKVVPQRSHGKYVYISMGGKHLVDHEAVYRRIGIKNLFSFDGDEITVARQNCNRPHDRAVCEHMLSSGLAGSMDRILKQFDSAEHCVIWLDYTSADRLAQIQEFTEVLKRCQPGDVARITLNAKIAASDKDWQESGLNGPGEYRAKVLRDQLGDFFPAEIESVPNDQVPFVLAKCIALACSEAQSESNCIFLPILLTSYADGQRMFTATVIAHAPGERLIEGLQGWEFLTKNWSKIIEISAPDLSIREKIEIDKHLKKSPKAIMKRVKFQPSSELDDAEHAIASYKRLHRFYPTFYAIGLQ